MDSFSTQISPNIKGRLLESPVLSHSAKLHRSSQNYERRESFEVESSVFEWL